VDGACQQNVKQPFRPMSTASARQTEWPLPEKRRCPYVRRSGITVARGNHDGTTDHAAERNAGSGQAGSVTERSDGASPCGTRTAWSGAGPGSSRRDSFAGAAGAGTASPTSGVAASVEPYTSPRSTRTKTFPPEADPLPAGNQSRLWLTHHPGRRFARAQGVSFARRFA
jgi:hypothetical protein